MIKKIESIQTEFNSANLIFKNLEEEKKIFATLQAKIDQSSEINIKNQEITDKLLEFHYKQRGKISQKDQQRIYELIPQLPPFQMNDYILACNEYDTLKLNYAKKAQQHLSEYQALVHFFRTLKDSSIQ